MDALIFITVYAVIGGAVGKRAHLHASRRCDRRYHTDDCKVGHMLLAIFSGLLWFVMVPIFAGIALGGKTDKQTRLEAQRQKELTAAEHDRKVAHSRRLEAEELSIQLRAMGKDV